MVFSFLTKKRNRSDDDWKVVRVAVKDEAQRKREGGSFRSPQVKTACDSIKVKEHGAVGTIAPRIMLGELRKRTIEDFNHYRSTGHVGRFTAGTNDRAISIATTAAYAKLEAAFSGTPARITHGDLGENILFKGCPSATQNAETGLYVGAKIAIGDTVLLEITEANNPCYRFNSQPWAKTAQKLWGGTAPDVKQWFKSPECPLNHNVFPGIRGWLARVVTEGTVKPGDTVKVLSRGDSSLKEENTKLPTAKADEDEVHFKDVETSPPPSKRRKKG